MTKLPAAAKWVSPALGRLSVDPVPGLIVWGQRRAVVIDCATATDEKNRPVTMLAFDVSTRPDAPVKIWLSVKQLQALNPIVDLCTYEEEPMSDVTFVAKQGDVVMLKSDLTVKVLEVYRDTRCRVLFTDGSVGYVGQEEIAGELLNVPFELLPGASVALLTMPDGRKVDADTGELLDEDDYANLVAYMGDVCPLCGGNPMSCLCDPEKQMEAVDAGLDGSDDELERIIDGQHPDYRAELVASAILSDDETTPDFDGDECPDCHGKHTVRIDTFGDDPYFWICECVDCERTFEIFGGMKEADSDADTQDDDQPGWLASADSGDPLAFAVDSDTDVLPSPDTIAMLKDAAGYVPPTDIHADPYTERMAEIETPEQTILNLTGYLTIAHQTIQQQTTVVNDLRTEVMDLEKKLTEALKAAKLPNPGELYTAKTRLAEAEKDRDYYRAELGKANDTGYKSKFDRAQSRIQELEAQLHQYQQPDLFTSLGQSVPGNRPSSGIQVMYWSTDPIGKPDAANLYAKDFADLRNSGWKVAHEQFENGKHVARLEKRQQPVTSGSRKQQSEAIPQPVPVTTIPVPEAAPVNNGHSFPPVPPRPFGTYNHSLPITPGSPFTRTVPVSTLTPVTGSPRIPTITEVHDALERGDISAEFAGAVTTAMIEAQWQQVVNHG